jgi:ABC-type phosphate transport system auxiliary subunit
MNEITEYGNNSDFRVDVGVLKKQVLTLETLCNKMDVVIDKIVDLHNRDIEKVYVNMNNLRLENQAETKELNMRIDTVMDKLQLSETRIRDEIKSIHDEIQKNTKEGQQSLDKINEWKWKIIGGMIALSWIFSQVKIESLLSIMAPK